MHAANSSCSQATTSGGSQKQQPAPRPGYSHPPAAPPSTPFPEARSAHGPPKPAPWQPLRRRGPSPAVLPARRPGLPAGSPAGPAAPWPPPTDPAAQPEKFMQLWFQWMTNQCNAELVAGANSLKKGAEGSSAGNPARLHFQGWMPGHPAAFNLGWLMSAAAEPRRPAALPAGCSGKLLNHTQPHHCTRRAPPGCACPTCRLMERSHILHPRGNGRRAAQQQALRQLKRAAQAGSETAAAAKLHPVCVPRPKLQRCTKTLPNPEPGHPYSIIHGYVMLPLAAAGQSNPPLPPSPGAPAWRPPGGLPPWHPWRQPATGHSATLETQEVGRQAASLKQGARQAGMQAGKRSEQACQRHNMHSQAGGRAGGWTGGSRQRAPRGTSSPKSLPAGRLPAAAGAGRLRPAGSQQRHSGSTTAVSQDDCQSSFC